LDICAFARSARDDKNAYSASRCHVFIAGPFHLAKGSTKVIRSRMDKRTANNVGRPDLIFAWPFTPIAMEVKLPGEKLSPEQETMRRRTGGFISSYTAWTKCARRSLKRHFPPIRGKLENFTNFDAPR
jgi:hypothetical protein